MKGPHSGPWSLKHPDYRPAPDEDSGAPTDRARQSENPTAAQLAYWNRGSQPKAWEVADQDEEAKLEAEKERLKEVSYPLRRKAATTGD